MNNILLWILAICQLLDGFLTYVGIKHFNTTEIEGNPLVRHLVEISDHFVGLLAVKALALFIIFVLSFIYGGKRQRLSKALLGLTCIYVIVVLMWVYILTRECGLNMCIGSIL